MKTKTWRIAMNPEEFRKNDIITADKSGGAMVVIKVYRMTWLKRKLRDWGIKRNWFLGVKVKPFTTLFVDL